MNELQQKIRQHASSNPHKVAIKGALKSLDYQTLVNEIDQAINKFDLSETTHQTFAIVMDNNPAWAVMDLALLFTNQCAVPLPKFFSIEQLKHALIDSGVQNLILDNSEFADKLIIELADLLTSDMKVTIAEHNLSCYQLKTPSRLSTNYDITSAVKITYTSGTTSKPKGVVLSEDAIISKVIALAIASEASESDISLSILPLATLLENIGGLYVPLFCGASVILLPPEQTGISGSSHIVPQKLLTTIARNRPTAFIIIPQFLQLLIHAIDNGYILPDSIRFIAMGGAPVSLQLLKSAKKHRIPVYEGYGLSEAASVVAVNNPTKNRLGSVGQVLNIHDIRISEEQEILIKGHLFRSYLGNPDNDSNCFYATGDIGKLDKNGFLYVTGRKKNIINSSYGRNISPEWVEKELEACPLIAQCLVYGHAKPFLIAIIVPFSDENMSSAQVSSYKAKIKEFINRLNKDLPDYARVMEIVFSNQPFTLENDQLTGTGRPRRSKIYQAYDSQIQDCYNHNLSNHQIHGAST